MSKRGTWVPYQSFRGGQKSDLPAHLIPDDSMLLAENIITNKIGRAAKRGPVQPYLSKGVQANIEQIGVTKLTIGSSVPVGIGVSAYDQGWYSFGLPTKAAPRVGGLSVKQSFAGTGRAIDLTPASTPVFGPSFNSFGLTGFPLTSAATNVTSPFVFFSTASDSTYTLSTTGACTLTAGKNTIGVPASVVSLNPVGSFIYISKWAGSGNTTNEYIGYITAVGSSTVDVYPAPTTSFTSTGTGIVQVSPYQSIIRNTQSPSANTTLVESGGGIVPQSASFACVHQNRVVVCTQAENSVDVNGTLNDYTKTRGNIVSWSAITGESATSANTGADGILSMLQAGWPKGQRLTLDTAQVVALVSMDANNLMVLCIDKVLMISGTLGTVVSAAGVNTSSFSVRTVAADVGCIDADSVQRTPSGVMFASRNGVYLTDGTTFTNIMVNKIQGEWNTYQYSQANSVCGSAVLNDTHYVLFTEKGPHFICDMTNDFAWTKITTNSDLDGNLLISLETATQALYTKAAATYTSSARAFSGASGTGLGNGVLVSSIALGGDLWVQTTTGTGASLTQITGVTTDTVTTQRDIGVSDNALRVIVPTGLPGLSSARVYTISGSAATLEQNLTVPSGKTFSPVPRVDMNGAGNVVVVSLMDGFAVYERVGTTWSNTATFTVFSANSANPVISNDGSTIVVSQTGSGMLVNVYKKPSTTWTLNASLVGDNPSTTSIKSFANNTSVSSDGYWITVNGNTSTENKISTWYYNGTTWSSVATFTVGSTSFSIVDAVAVNANGYIAYNYYYSSGISANNSYASLIRYNKTALAYETIRSSTPQSTLWGAGRSGSTTAVPCFAWSSDSTRLTQWRNIGTSLAVNTTISTFATTRSTYQSYGIGIRDWSGSGEVYAPRYGGPIVTFRADAVSLLDSILLTDSPITTTASGFNQLVDAGTSTAYNATIETKSYTFGEPASLKVYKSLLFVYDADSRVDGVNPVNIYSSQGLEPVFDFTGVAPLSIPATPAPTPAGSTTNTRFSIYPRQIDNGIAFGFKTAYTAADSAVNYGRFQLYELSINAAELRKGRTFQ